MDELGIKVVKIDSPPEWAADPNLAIPVITAAIAKNPTVKAIGYPGGQELGDVPTYMQAADKKPGEIFNFGFDTSPQIVEGFNGGWVQLTADQQPFMQVPADPRALPGDRLRTRAHQRRHRRGLRDARQLQGRRQARERRPALNRVSAPASACNRGR
jgi:hypothetical protein